MNIYEQVIEFLQANPMSNTTQIATGVGYSSGLMRGVMAELYRADKVFRQVSGTKGYQYLVKSEAGDVANAEYTRSRKLAEELEVKGFWRRAAQQWLEAMDGTRDEGLMEKAATRRDFCNRMSCRHRSAYSGASIPDASASSLPALALWRD
ncbi:PerC family transcriptional regulator [Winslowiella arboricola]|uniref:PerC family transcriptional regulator n=1 Tax=Winslowiella arboricola TaxID=2978220 RepID=UPI00225E1F13|nr:PerC family transcriptional regulator [Winslowiella arboricola]MCU5775203.1 PerC family transcriptional regulator [Winslowiella arboricola]